MRFSFLLLASLFFIITSLPLGAMESYEAESPCAKRKKLFGEKLIITTPSFSHLGATSQAHESVFFEGHPFRIPQTCSHPTLLPFSQVQSTQQTIPYALREALDLNTVDISGGRDGLLSFQCSCDDCLNNRNQFDAPETFSYLALQPSTTTESTQQADFFSREINNAPYPSPFTLSETLESDSVNMALPGEKNCILPSQCSSSNFWNNRNQPGNPEIFSFSVLPFYTSPERGLDF